MIYLKNVLISMLPVALFVFAWGTAVWFLRIRPHLADGEGAVYSISGALPRWIFLFSAALVFCGVFAYLNGVRNRRQRKISSK